MRSITQQGTGVFHLGQAHSHKPQTSAEAQTRWQHFAHKPMLLEALKNEQYQLCCYSELRADEEDLGCHIEHIENKSQNPQRTFDYSNLAASALDSHDLSLLSRDESFGGHAAGKQQGCDMERFVSCHQPDCARYFAYLSDGRVIPRLDLNSVERERAKYTIELLNLNSPYLLTRRQQWWNELDELYAEHITKEWNIADLAAIDLVPTEQKLSRFFSLTRQFFGQVAENVLHLHALELV
ncbi:hypothetical protein A6M27_14515 [Acidithiobacillus thiooxidans]|uniref:TIGR02646 family protein n=1 Tax=Acidithiobacillus thiooxidans TaxID=930 RepID=A0A1C2IRU8_ACITH|nr:retron system putative HNH endonuclease [Acidithiobacillus thiooxidans]OCX69004.1 hypothetical protein A6P07_17310 [Acidithiobacillus thiooxidans]OCX76207.1 hypothetical protein A6O24_08880 [Acidithiobacillus thiooxidans]OCX78738.1 hypothetical protein A6O26_17720 [Acidithiobacillus thiooxidans]OCX85861.1 hypothetical protein A6M27_14515 [Acidithiobacillus thiooxidans]OFC41022.1 TIGR02646 family protein [Acidithiobacillus thiooxidans]